MWRSVCNDRTKEVIEELFKSVQRGDDTVKLKPFSETTGGSEIQYEICDEFHNKSKLANKIS